MLIYLLIALIFTLIISLINNFEICLISNENLLISVMSTFFTLGSIVLTVKSILLTSSFSKTFLRNSSDEVEASKILKKIYDYMTDCITTSIVISFISLILLLLKPAIEIYKIKNMFFIIKQIDFSLFISLMNVFLLAYVIYLIIIFFEVIRLFSAIIKEYFT